MIGEQKKTSNMRVFTLSQLFCFVFLNSCDKVKTRILLGYFAFMADFLVKQKAYRRGLLKLSGGFYF